MRSRPPGSAAAALVAALILLAAALSGCAGTSQATVNLTSGPLSVSPIPGSRVASPSAQIVFRGLPVREISHVSVIGSRTGDHTGRLMSDSDNDGGSFLLDRPFDPGERVTVRAQLRRSGPTLLTFGFQVAHPVGQIPDADLHFVSRNPGDVMRFHSRPDLDPPAVKMDRRSTMPVKGRIFLGPEEGPVQSGAMILDPDGSLVWFHAVPKGQVVSDFKVQRYMGRPVLTWFEGYIGSGAGNGEDHIFNSSYHQVAVVRGADGLSADMHEFVLMPGGRALITSYFPVRWADSPAPGSRMETVLDGVVQEIDVKTGLLLFQWDSLDHVPLSASYVAPDKHKPYDYFHINSVDVDRDGNLIISSRNTWAVYKVSGLDGHVIWTLGGKHSTFRLPAQARFAFQHDVRVRAAGDQVLTLFDNGAGPPDIDTQSRGLTLRLDMKRKIAAVLQVEEHSPPLLAHFEGNVQELAGGGQFMGWGQRPYFTLYARGRTLIDGHFVDQNPSYRAFLEPWTGTPSDPPAIAASRTASGLIVYASWNGATDVNRWRVLTGSRPGALAPASPVHPTGFETAIPVPAAPYVAVQALNAQGRVLGTSRTIRAG